ncbi:hypothetical protein Ahy_A10g047754 isoform C [Arachis hypogaea]|uniref:Uncharacterized protein n=1 Tax=Arachis hypogaea TaxID=3818 RepID=A0A445B3I3_ARAHY|nr:hypothetical protein Ahy_A10g047754 isoform C [Arachis hypogaea]
MQGQINNILGVPGAAHKLKFWQFSWSNQGNKVDLDHYNYPEFPFCMLRLEHCSWCSKEISEGDQISSRKDGHFPPTS